MEKSLYDKVFELEQTHWWFCARRKIVFSLLDRFLRKSGKGQVYKICDMGCACGLILAELSKAGYDAVGVDSSDTALEYCADRGVRVLKGSLPHQIPLEEDSLDAVLMLDVLEHISDDKASIQSAIRFLRPGGLIICTVPAYSWLWTKRDEFHHHARRYSMSYFKEILSSCTDAEIVIATHINAFLFPLALAERLGRRLFGISPPTADISVPPLGLNCVMKKIFSAERHLINRRIRLPFGLSILAVARKR
jgi:SAM-dependent methyltransferase